MDESVVERLRESKTRGDAEQKKLGIEAGREWAKTGAEYQELRNLAKTFERAEPREQDCLFIVGSGNNLNGGMLFLRAIRPGEDVDAEYSDFWESAFGEDQDDPDDELVQAFAEGALEVFNEVAAKL